jgi:hypothetical protein
MEKGRWGSNGGGREGAGGLLGLETAKVLIYDAPYHIIVLHSL